MLLRGALGPSSGNYAQVPLGPLHGLAPRKPCGSVPSSVFGYAKPAPRKRAVGQPRTTAINPLFLFYCGLRWQRFGETDAGWELVQAMRSNNLGARALSAEFLAQTEDGRLLVRDLRRTRGNLGLIVTAAAVTRTEVERMKTPYGLPIIENCVSCPLTKAGWFCHFSGDLLRSFNASSHLATYPGGAILFVEGQKPRGAYVLCSGKVKLSTTSREGKVLVLKMVVPGEAIGLSALISGEAYEITAETLEPCVVNFVEREGLLRLMERSGELGLRSAQAVSREFQYAYREFHELVLARSSSGKLARLLLSWMNELEPGTRELKIHAPVTHEEMAQRIGASRETVTRLLSELRRKDLIKLEGTTLVIKNRTALEALAV